MSLTTIWRFEEPNGVAPSDELGGVDDLVVPAGHSGGVYAEGPLGRARFFTGDAPSALQGTDLVTSATLHTRDVSVQVVVQWTLDEQTPFGPGTIVCRGIDGSAAERYAFGLELRVVDGGGIGELRWFWHTVAGVLKVQIGGHFKVPANQTSDYIMLTATRRWISPTEVELRYYAGADLLAEVISSDGDIGGGTTGHVSIGARCEAGTWGSYLWGAIDELAIYDHALCAEEIEATWLRITEHQPNGAELMHDLAPPGAPISDDPASRIQRLLRLIGEGLGFAAAKGEAVRSYTMPDRAFGSTLERWEAIARLPSRPRTALDIRRRRVIAHLRSRGIDLATVREALREVLDLHPSQIEILNFSNDVTDPFDSIRSERWQALPASSDWVAASNAANAIAAAGTDARWDGVVRNARRLRMAAPDGRSAYLGARMTPIDFPGDSEGGLLLEHGSRGDRLFFGVRNTAGTLTVVYQRWRAGVLVDASPVVLATIAGDPYWLRIRRDPVDSADPALGETELRLEWSLDGVTFATQGNVLFINDHQWAGFYARGTDASLSADLQLNFDEFRMRLPFGKRPFRWYAYRDPAIAGTADLVGGNALLKRLRHAYTQAAAITTYSLLCDEEASGCDLGPMGGF